MTETTLNRLLIPVLCILALSGCSNGDDDSDRIVGSFTQVGVENLSFETPSTAGTTGDNGTFTFLPGEEVSFSIGNLQIASDVPAAPFLTSLEITENQRQRLRAGGTSDRGLQTHRVVEQELARENNVAINTMRLIMVLGQDLETEPSDTIRITERTINQINEFLAEQENPGFDSSRPVEAFARPEVIEFDDEGNLTNDPSPVNRMLDSICFEPEGDELCEDPPTRGDIDDAPEDSELQEELTGERSDILDARRNLNDISVEDVSDFLEAETLSFRNQLEAPFFLDPEAITLTSDQTGIQTVNIRRIGDNGFELKPNALSARAEGSSVSINATSWQTGEVEYFHDGEDGDTGTILVNFKVDTPNFDNYRWFRKTLRVCIEDDGDPCST